MIVKPKKYDSDSLGGYLLNDVEYADTLIIPKKSYGKDSVVNNENIIYHMINNISGTPFKINTELLDFINSTKGSYFLLDPSVPHIYENKYKLNKREKAILKSHNSKRILQETIL